MNPTIRDRIKALRRVKAAELTPSPKNWRSHPQVQRDALNGVLAQVGYADAILVREVNGGGLEIIDGHLRVEEADPDQELPVLVLDVSEEEASLILATHDPLGAMAYPDLDLYLPLIEDLNPDSDAVAALLEAVANNEARPLYEPLVPEERGLTDPDHLPVVDEKDAVVKLGQVWALGDHRLACGDATSKDDVAGLMVGRKAHLVLTDPPYLVDYDGGRHPQSWSNRPEVKDKHWDEYREQPAATAFYERFINTALAEAVEANAGWYQWYASLRAPEVHEAWRKCGLLTHCVIVWVKSRPVLTHTRYMWQHELCVYGWRQGAPPATRPPANAKTVWEIDQQGQYKADHPTQKPVALLETSILHQSGQGDVCYDPFVGSGTTIIAAEKTGRICYAMDIEPRYCDVAIRRWEEYTGKTAALVEDQG